MIGFMEEQPPTPDPLDLDALDDYLMSDHAPDDCMGLSDLDGFLTGIVVSPELILPSEWLPVIWGGQEPEFRTEAEMRTFLGTIMGRYDEIVACLADDPDDLDPILNGDLEPDSGPDGVVDEDEVLAEAADMIPTCVAGIYEFWRDQSKQAARQK